MSYSFVWENYYYELIALYLFALNEFIHFSINQLLYVILLENDDIWTAAEPPKLFSYSDFIPPSRCSLLLMYIYHSEYSTLL